MEGSRTQSASLSIRDNPMKQSYTSSMEAADNSYGPGVGAYDVTKSYIAIQKKAPMYSCSYKTPLKLSVNQVGPGSYNTNETLTKSGAFMAQSARKSTVRSSTPECVGPAGYHPQNSLKNSNYGYSMSYRHNSLNKNQNPGVGTYNIDNAGNTDKGASNMGSRYLKFGNMYNVTHVVPGIGSYNIDVENLERGKHGFTFGKEVKSNEQNKNPGVGTYETIPKRSSSGAGTFGARTKGRHF